jgi:hypothetical protein
MIKREALGGKLLPGCPLSSKEDSTQGERSHHPWQGSVQGGVAEAKPFFKYVNLAEDILPGNLHREAAEQQNCGIQVEDRRKQNRMPIADLLVSAGVHMGAGLARKEERNKDGEEHHVACESRKEKEANFMKQLARSTAIVLPIVVATASSATGRPAI